MALTVMSQHRFDPGVIELKRLIDDGALGRLVLGEASTKWYRTQAYYDSAPWRGTWAMDGGALLNQGIHYVDLLRWCMGPATEVTAVCTTQAHASRSRTPRSRSSGSPRARSARSARPRRPTPASRNGWRSPGRDGTVTVEDGQLVRTALREGADARAARARPGAVGRGGPRRPGRRRPRRAARRPARGGRRGTRARGQRPGRPRRAGDRPRRLRVVPRRPAGEARPVTVTLSGFADEISADPAEQFAVLAAESITHLELRSAWSVNVADFSGVQVGAFRVASRDAGVRVSAIGSPIGKIAVDAPLEPELERMRRDRGDRRRSRHRAGARLLVLPPARRAAAAVPGPGHRPDGGAGADRGGTRRDPRP